MDREQDALKTIANAISYGIFIEINTEDGEKKVDLYGLKHYRTKTSKKETFDKNYQLLASTLFDKSNLI